jgi:hypothetical protein
MRIYTSENASERKRLQVQEAFFASREALKNDFDTC